MKRVIIALRVLALMAIVAMLVVPMFAGPVPADSSGAVSAPPLPKVILDLIPWVLLAISEIMGLVPALKSNGILHFIVNILTKLAKKD